MAFSSIILAAGKGTRMHSQLPKALHKLASIPMIDYIIQELSQLKANDECVIVIGDDMLSLEQHVKAKKASIKCAVQKKRLGTADAVKVGSDCLDNRNQDLLVLYGDTPLINANTIMQMHDALQQEYASTALVLLGFASNDPGMRGRCVVNSAGYLEKIVEYLDCTQDERSLKTCNQGTMLINKLHKDTLLAAVKNNNAKKEFYLTDLVELAVKRGLKCKLILEPQAACYISINTKAELAAAECMLQNMLREKFLSSGVTLIDPSTVYFSTDTIIERDVVIEPNVFIGPGVKVCEGAHIKSFSYLEGVSIGTSSVVGPFARLRPDTDIGSNVRIGNFVEIKNSQIADGSRVNHLSYIGDATLGHNVNIGAGTITCNYDGTHKHKTIIKEGAFIGSNVALIAPVSIGKHTLIAAGSVITKDVQPEALAISRPNQKNIQSGARRLISKKAAEPRI